MPITSNNPIKLFFSNKKVLTRTTQIENSIFLIQKPVLSHFLKLLVCKNNYLIFLVQIQCYNKISNVRISPNTHSITILLNIKPGPKVIQKKYFLTFLSLQLSLTNESSLTLLDKYVSYSNLMYTSIYLYFDIPIPHLNLFIM